MVNIIIVGKLKKKSRMRSRQFWHLSQLLLTWNIQVAFSLAAYRLRSEKYPNLPPSGSLNGGDGAQLRSREASKTTGKIRRTKQTEGIRIPLELGNLLKALESKIKRTHSRADRGNCIPMFFFFVSFNYLSSARIHLDLGVVVNNWKLWYP